MDKRMYSRVSLAVVIFASLALAFGTFSQATVVPAQAVTTAPPVSVAYGDTHHPPSNGNFPSPWAGSPNIVFQGTQTNDWDGGAVKIDNTTGAPLTGVTVTVDVG